MRPCITIRGQGTLDQYSNGLQAHKTVHSLCGRLAGVSNLNLLVSLETGTSRQRSAYSIAAFPGNLVASGGLTQLPKGVQAACADFSAGAEEEGVALPRSHPDGGLLAPLE